MANPPTSEEDLMEQIQREFGDDLAGLGGDLAELAGGGDPYGIFMGNIAPTDPVGAKLRPRFGRPGAPLGARGTDRARGPFQGDTLITESVGEILKKFYELEPSVLRRMQALLFAGGFYGDAEIDGINWGQHDDASFAAWSQAVARTARLNAAGKKVTYDQVIGDTAWAAGLDPENLGRALEEGDDSLEALLDRFVPGPGRIIGIDLSDPNRLRSTMDNVAGAVLGRKSNAAEQRMFISMIHDLQRRGQIAFATAEPGDTVPVGADPVSALGFDDDAMLRAGDVVTEYAPPDEAATAESLLRQQNPAEAGAHDIAMQFAALLEMLPAPVDVPRITL